MCFKKIRKYRWLWCYIARTFHLHFVELLFILQNQTSKKKREGGHVLGCREETGGGNACDSWRPRLFRWCSVQWERNNDRWKGSHNLSHLPQGTHLCANTGGWLSKIFEFMQGSAVLNKHTLSTFGNYEKHLRHMDYLDFVAPFIPYTISSQAKNAPMFPVLMKH